MAGRAELPSVHGLLVVDKPAGWTSHDVVARIRRLVGLKRVGHGGTLDPFATGVVVVAVGRATRLLQYVQDSDKRYLAQVMFGAATDTLDVDGEVTRRSTSESFPRREEIDAVLPSFVGESDQIPPAYSAIRIDGRRLYERARAGEQVDPPPRRVRIDAINVLAYDPPALLLDIACGKGTYIRSIARDIGERLGCDAYCHALRRVRNGPFTLADAWTLDELASFDLRERWPEVATHPDRAVAGLNAIVLNGEQTASWYHGRSVCFGDRDARFVPSAVRVYSADGRFVGIGRYNDDDILRPAFVFSAGEEGGT